MKKFIVFIIAAIITAFAFNSCTSKVKNDIKTIVGDNVKVCSIKSITINKDFYKFTDEYIKNKHALNDCISDIDFNESRMKSEMKDMEYYKGWVQSAYKLSKQYYEEYKAKVEECKDSLKVLSEINGRLENNTIGKIYVVQLKSKDEYTHRYYDVYHYGVYSYNTDGTIHGINTEDTTPIIYSIFPKMVEDIEKATKIAVPIIANALAKL